MEEALIAIIARINGEWDNVYLLGFGPLSTDTLADIQFIAEQGMKGEASILEARA